MRDRLHEMVQNLEKSNDTLTAAQANGVVDGFKQLGLLYWLLATLGMYLS